MEAAVTESVTRERAALGAPTIAEAFRITAAERADEVAIRTKDDAFTITWGELRERVDALAGRTREARRCERGDTLALMLGNRPEFHLCDLAAMMLGATPVLDLQHLHAPSRSQYLVADAEARILICEQQYLPQVLRGAQGAARPRARDRRRRRGPRGHARAGRRRGLEPRLRRRGVRRADPADRRADADLHLRHDRPAEGRAAGPPQPAGGRRGPRRADRVSRATGA